MIYDFERQTLIEGWQTGLIVNAGDYDSPEFRIREPRRLLRVLYHWWVAASEIERSEWWVDQIALPFENQLMKQVMGYGDWTLTDGVLLHLEELVDTLEGRAVLCDLEDAERPYEDRTDQ